MGRTSAFIAGFEKAAAAFPLKLPNIAGFLAKAPKGVAAKVTKVAPKSAVPKSTAQPTGSWGVSTRATTKTPLSSVSPAMWDRPLTGRWAAGGSQGSRAADVVKVNKPPQPSSIGRGGPAATTTAPKSAPTTQATPNIAERFRKAINDPGNKFKTYAGMGIVGTGAALYGANKLLSSTLGPSTPQNDW